MAFKNQLLQQSEAGLEENVPPEMKAAYGRIVLAGLKIMFDDKTHAKMQEALQAEGDMVQNIANGIAGLMAMLYNQSKETMPVDAAIMASNTLTLHALDYVERTEGTEITAEVLAATVKATMEQVLLKFGVTPEKLQEMVNGAGSPEQGQPAQGQPMPAQAAQPQQAPPQQGQPQGILQGA